MKKVLIEKNKLIIEIEPINLGNEQGHSEWVKTRLYINGKLYIDKDGVDTFYDVCAYGRNGVVEVTLNYTTDRLRNFNQVVLDQFDLKSYVGLKCKKSKIRVFKEWSKEIHENEKSKHFANVSWKVFEKYNNLFPKKSMETIERKAEIAKEATTSEAEKALCDLVLLYAQSFKGKFIIPNWYDKIDAAITNLKNEMKVAATTQKKSLISLATLTSL